MTLLGWLVLAGVVGAVGVAVRLGFYFRYTSAYEYSIDKAKNGCYKRATLTYNEFIKFYSLNPDKWDIRNTEDIVYNKECSNKCYRITFNTYSDYRKFVIWHLNRQERLEEEQLLCSNLAFCDTLKQDINELKKESRKQIKQAQEQSMDIIQQYFANERAKKEKEKIDNSSLNPIHWPIWDCGGEPFIGKVYSRIVEDGSVQYGYYQEDGTIKWLDNTPSLPYATPIQPLHEIDWDALLKSTQNGRTDTIRGGIGNQPLGSITIH